MRIVTCGRLATTISISAQFYFHTNGKAFILVSVAKTASLLKICTGNLDEGDWFRTVQQIFQSQKGCELKKNT